MYYFNKYKVTLTKYITATVVFLCKKQAEYPVCFFFCELIMLTYDDLFVIRFFMDDPVASIDLFQQDHTHKLMWKCHI